MIKMIVVIFKMILKSKKEPKKMIKNQKAINRIFSCSKHVKII